MKVEEKNERNWESYIIIPVLMPIEILGNIIRVFIVTPLCKIIIGGFIFGLPYFLIWMICAFVMTNGMWLSQNWNWTRPIALILCFPFIVIGGLVNFSMYTEDEERKDRRTKMLMFFPFYEPWEEEEEANAAV